MSTPGYIEEIMSTLKTSYPDMEFSSYHHSVTATVRFNDLSDYIQLVLTERPNLNNVSIYEENWLKSKKWICYNRAYSEAYGSGSRFGGEDPIKVFEEAVDGLHYRLNRLIEQAKISEIFLQKTAKEKSNANPV